MQKTDRTTWETPQILIAQRDNVAAHHAQGVPSHPSSYIERGHLGYKHIKICRRTSHCSASRSPIWPTKGQNCHMDPFSHPCTTCREGGGITAELVGPRSAHSYTILTHVPNFDMTHLAQNGRCCMVNHILDTPEKIVRIDGIAEITQHFQTAPLRLRPTPQSKHPCTLHTLPKQKMWMTQVPDKASPTNKKKDTRP